MGACDWREVVDSVSAVRRRSALVYGREGGCLQIQLRQLGADVPHSSAE